MGSITTLFGLTFLVEFFIVWLFLRKSVKGLQLLEYVFLINMFTWPIANVLFFTFGSFWTIEVGVILVESYLILLLMEIKFKKALLISFVANIVTILFSFLLFFI